MYTAFNNNLHVWNWLRIQLISLSASYSLITIEHEGLFKTYVKYKPVQDSKQEETKSEYEKYPVQKSSKLNCNLNLASPKGLHLVSLE